jgi:hypothetical protein
MARRTTRMNAFMASLEGRRRSHRDRGHPPRLAPKSAFTRVCDALRREHLRMTSSYFTNFFPVIRSRFL